ncbi:hypothetical protein ACRAWD_01020 [Caulobacter segnis]
MPGEYARMTLNGCRPSPRPPARLRDNQGTPLGASNFGHLPRPS